ncbi:MAG TPA: MarR family transcriptional regulator, partial [Solirubrobacteraceae bacterium]|nr:MarR family transcriptional regulator [Solirubrobacteraceae bacterium]
MSRETKAELLQKVIYAARANEAAVDRFDRLAAEALGINRTDARCLDIVDNEGGGITAGRIAELSGLTTAAVTTVLDRLEAKGYVRRARDERDRRRVLVELTPTFRERAQAIWGPLGGEARRAMDRFSAEELRTALAWFELSREV